jgi:hypothetical protein
MTKDKPPSYSEIVRELLLDLDGPIPVEEFIDRFLEIRVPGSKNPRSSVRSKIREENGWSLVFADSDHILPIEMAYLGIRFRVKLTKKMIYKGLLPLEDFIPYLPRTAELKEPNFFDQDGSRLGVGVINITKKVQSPFGTYDEDTYHLNLKKWFRQHKAQKGDHVFVTLSDFFQKKFLLELEPKGNLNQDILHIRNQQLADILFDILEESRYEQLFSYVGIPTAYARMPDKSGYPPDSVIKVIDNDPRRVWWGMDIRYSDASPSFFERFLAQEMEISNVPPVRDFSTAESEQVFRFKAVLKYRKGLWRKIEIQGAQTLAEFNIALMQAFHYGWDHLGGFWKIVPRGGSTKRKRYREVNLGSVNPFGEGDGAEKQIAGLGLKNGDRLKYVYDFGDWIEHEITLETIIPPEPEVTYPRLVDQNKPRYRYCKTCKEMDRKTRATWVCFTCSGKEQREILICEDCLDENHQDHYAEEYLY